MKLKDLAVLLITIAFRIREYLNGKGISRWILHKELKINPVTLEDEGEYNSIVSNIIDTLIS